MAVAGTPAGEALFESPIFRKGDKSHVEKRHDILDDVRKRFKTTTSWFSATVRYVSRGEILDKTWEEIGNRCLECGGCTYVCPACTCFTVSDRKVGENEIERVRIWDACALSRLHAHGRGPQPAQGDPRPPQPALLPQAGALLHPA